MVGVEDNGYVRWLKHRYEVGELEAWELEEQLDLALRADEELVAYPTECCHWLATEEQRERARKIAQMARDLAERY